MNKFTFYGRLAQDPEIRTITGENATAIATANIAVSRRFKREGQPEADFFRITTFGKQAEVLNNYFRKGSRIVISGRIQNNNFTKQNGEKVYGFEFIAEEIDFVDTKAESEASGRRSTSNNTNTDDFINVPEGMDDELPFN